MKERKSDPSFRERRIADGGGNAAVALAQGVRQFICAAAPDALPAGLRASNAPSILTHDEVKALAAGVPPRPPGFCTGCPERPIFAAMKLVEKERGAHHVAADLGCHLFSILPRFNIGTMTMGYGLGPASASAFVVKAGKRPIAMVGDGGLWHNGLASGIGNAIFNQHDGVTIVVGNYYSSATGGQDILSSRAHNKSRSTKHPIADVVKATGAKWVQQIHRTYDVAKVRDTLKEALVSPGKGPKIIIASSECMLNRPRRDKPLFARAAQAGERVVRERFGVDEDVWRSRMHQAFRLPVIIAKADRRSAQGRPGGNHRQLLRRLRKLRRRCGSRGALPVLLSRRHPR